MSMTVPGRASVPSQAEGDAGVTIDLDAPAPAAGASERTRADGARDAIHVGACLLAGVLITTGFLLDVAGTDTDSGAELIAAVSENPNRFYAANTLAAFGLAMLPAVGLAVLRLVRGRGRVLATIGGVLVMIGGTAAAAGIFMYGAVVSVLAGPGQDAATSAALQDDLGDSARTGLTFIIGFPGTFLGLLVCAVALLVSRATPRWVPLTLVLGIVAVMALGSTDASTVGDLLLTAGLSGIGLSLWKATRPASQGPSTASR